MKDPGPMRYLSVWDFDFNKVSSLHFTEDRTIDTVIIYNTSGGHTVEIDSIFASTGGFLLNPSSAIILPGDSIHLTVRFDPRDEEDFIDTIFLASNDPYDSLLTIPLTSTLKLFAAFNDVKNISCYGKIDGSATITPFMGTPPYTYQWDDPWNTTDSTVTGLRPDKFYHVTPR